MSWSPSSYASCVERAAVAVSKYATLEKVAGFPDPLSSLIMSAKKVIEFSLDETTQPQFWIIFDTLFLDGFM